jgi:hypothetical protein
VKLRGVVESGISRIGSACVLGCALLWAGSLEATPGPQNTTQDEPTPIKLKVNRSITPADLKGPVNTQVQPTKSVSGKTREIARTHTGQAKTANQGGQGGVAFYPGDVIYQGGTTVTSLESHDIYVNCTASCFGYPATFLNHLGNSDLIHVTDQYVGAHASHRYTVGPGGTLQYPVSGPLGPNDFLSIAYAGASVFGTGYGHIYHVFLAPGIDVCLNAALTVCYSPDNPNTFYFCAFHGSVDFTDIGHVLFSVEPYANIPNACQVNQPSPNGGEIDSQANVLSHELIEAITDPDGTAWWNTYDLVMYGSEIGDECVQAYFDYPNTNIGGRVYEIQPEYSNTVHACTYHGTD